MITDPQSWEEGGIPDHLKFRRAVTAHLCFIRALNERRIACIGSPYSDIDRYQFFFPNQLSPFTFVLIWTILRNIGDFAPYFVKPDKIASAANYEDCFWTFDEIRHEVGDDLWPASESDWKPFLPEWPLKYVEPMYNAINLLRYVPTTKKGDWPDFEYEDKNDTFKFKAP